MEKQTDSLKNDTVLILSVISIVAIFIRLLPFSEVIAKGTVHTIGFDSYYHMRRIVFTADHFPDSLTFDSYLNYPQGLEIGWPPLYDQAIALLALINSYGSMDPFIVQLTAAIFPMILGIITFIPLFFATSMIFNRNVALLSVGILAILPTNIDFSMLGSTDHHIAEILLLTTSYAFLIAALKSPEHKYLSLSEFPVIGNGKSISIQSIFAIGGGGFLAISVLTWIGAPIFIGIITIYTAVQYTIDLKKNRPTKNLNKIFIPALFVTLVLTTLVTIRSVRPGLEISPVHISWFQVLFVVFMIISIAALSILAGFVTSKRLVWWSYPLFVVISTLGVVLIISSISQSAFISLKFGIDYLLGSSDVLGTINEAQPLIQGPEQTLITLVASFGSSIFLSIPAFILFTKKMIKENYPPELLFFATWALVIIILTLLQKRFINQLSIIVVILTGYFIILSIQILNSGKYTRSLKIAGIVILLLIVIIPNVYIDYLKATNPQLPPQDWVDSLEWLKENTPTTSYYNNPTTMPEYGVMSWWSYGNWIVYLAQRPVVTNNFQAGMEDAAGFFIESNATEAKSILDARNVRYIITSDEMVFLKNSNIAFIAGRDPDDYDMVSDKLKTTTMWSLHIGDGSGLGFYRLIHESKNAQIFPNIKSVKIFEYVKGANIIGQASPNEVVIAYTNISTNQNRVFTYFNAVKANETGWYRIKVAYPTTGSAYTTGIVEPYKVINSTNVVLKDVSVSEDDIIIGRSID